MRSVLEGANQGLAEVPAAARDQDSHPVPLDGCNVSPGEDPQRREKGDGRDTAQNRQVAPGWGSAGKDRQRAMVMEDGEVLHEPRLLPELGQDVEEVEGHRD